MEEIKKLMKENGRMIFIVLSIAMIVLLGVCPAVKASVSFMGVSGSESAGGFKLLFDGGEDLGFSRFLIFLMFVAPIVILIKQFTEIKALDKVKDTLELICFASSVFLFIIFAVTLPKASFGYASASISATVGAYLYLALAIVGGVGAFFGSEKFSK